MVEIQMTARAFGPATLPACAGAAGEAIRFTGLITIADLLCAAGIRDIRLAGDEPSLHPQFVAALRYFICRGFRIQVCTDGLWEDRLLEDVSALEPSSSLDFVVRLAACVPHDRTNGIGQDRFLHRFEGRCDLAIDASDLLQRAVDVDAAAVWLRGRRIRVIPGEDAGQERGVQPTSTEYAAAATRLVHLCDRLLDQGVRLVLAGGLPLYSFTDTQLGQLVRRNAQMGFARETGVRFQPPLEARALPLDAAAPRIEVSRKIRLADLRRALGHGVSRPLKNRELRFEQCADCAFFEQRGCGRPFSASNA